MKKCKRCGKTKPVDFQIPTSYEEYLMLTDEQKFKIFEITKKREEAR